MPYILFPHVYCMLTIHYSREHPMAILFRQDWLRYPTAIADYNTTNESFKRLVYLYKEIGIENAEFPLALMQPELSGVDPFAEDLTKEQKFKIGLEAKFNPWFFFS